jgi:hypothetical protein
VSAREKTLEAHQALLNGSGKLPYFKGRGFRTETVKSAWVGYDAERRAFTYPCIAKGGGLLAIHYKSEGRNTKGKRRQWWEGYAANLPPKGHGKRPEDPAKVIPFGLETLTNLEPGSLVVLCGGEEDALSVRQAGYVGLSQPGVGLLEPVYAKEFANLDVVLLYDAGEEAEAGKDALRLKDAGAARVRIASWPEDAPHGADANGRLVEDPEGFETWLQGMIDGAEPLPTFQTEEVERKGEPDQYSDEDSEAPRRKPTQAEVLIGCVAGVELFHVSEGDSYATIPIADHH